MIILPFLRLVHHSDFNHQCHPRYLGIEYSSVAVEEAKKRYGDSLNVKQGDATALELEDRSIDFLFTFATLETYFQKIQKAFEEIARVLSNGGIAMIKPAWNCRIWTVQKLKNLPYDKTYFL